MLDLNRIKEKFDRFFDETTENQFWEIIENNRRIEAELQQTKPLTNEQQA